MVKIIYEPSGRAEEYSKLAANLYKGCEHGCLYCYAPACTRNTKENSHGNPTVRDRVLEKLEQDLIELTEKGIKKESKYFKDEVAQVLLCFTTDPYQKDNEFNITTRFALELFRKYNVPFQILTKGGMKATRDFDLYGKNDAFATTLTFWNDLRSFEIEPMAATYANRIDAIRLAKNEGIKTWVSFEPVLDEYSVYRLLDFTHEFVDLYKVGKCSRYKNDELPYIDWKRFGHTIIEKLEKLGKKYYIKQDLRDCL